MKYKIALVIPVHNRLEHTKECLQMLDSQEGSLFLSNNDIKIILVDDGSTDGTAEWIQKNHPEVEIISGDGNLWYSGAMNLGIKNALERFESDFVLLWENDIFPKNGYFDNLQKILEQWNGKTIICSKLFYRNKPDRILGMGGTFNSKTGRKFLIGRTEKDGPDYQKDLEVDWFSGMGVLIHRNIIADVGYLDEKNFPQYHSDSDYALRAGYKGYKNVVYHKLSLLNDTETSGIRQKNAKSVKDYFTGLTSIRSKYNMRRNMKFYRIHATSIFAYRSLMRTYYVYTGSFLKWKVLGWFGIRKNSEKLS